MTSYGRSWLYQDRPWSRYNQGPHDFILLYLSIKKHHSCLFVEKTVLKIFYLYFLVQEQRKLKLSQKIIREEYVGEKKIKISSRPQVIKPQCSAGPVLIAGFESWVLTEPLKKKPGHATELSIELNSWKSKRRTIQESIAVPNSRSNQRTPAKIHSPLSQNGQRGATIHLHILQIGDSSK